MAWKRSKKCSHPNFVIDWIPSFNLNLWDQEIIKHVVDKFVIELEAQLEPKGVTIELDDAARLWLAERGYDRKMGARPMARVIQESIKKPLAEDLLFGRLVDGGRVLISVHNDELAIDIPETEEQVPG